MNDQLLTERQAAEELTLKTGTLRSWRYHKKGPDFIRLHGAIRYRKSKLYEFLEQGEVKREKSA